MSKLFKVKEWLTVDEAAKHLSTMLGEEVVVADIYRLALDSQITLSMNFPNKTYANPGEVVTSENIQRFKLPPEMLQLIPEKHREEGDNEIIVSHRIGENIFINWEDSVATIDGVWDLAMIASERIDVEYVYHQLIGGPKIDLVGLDGAFVRRGDAYCRLVESYDENEFRKGTSAARREIERFLSMNEVSDEREKEIWNKFEGERKEYLKEKMEAPYERDFFPAGGLPRDGVYVVRTAAIVDFLERLNETPKLEKPISTKERNSMLTLIAALCEEANFDYKQRGIAAALAASTEKLGKPLTDDTIRNILKQVKELFS